MPVRCEIVEVRHLEDRVGILCGKPGAQCRMDCGCALCEAHRDSVRVRPNVGRRAHVNGATAAERAGVRQEKCGDIHRIGKSSLSVFGCRIQQI